MSSSIVSGFHPPRIYSLDSSFLAQDEVWDNLLARVSTMQFNAVLLANPGAMALDSRTGNTLRSFAATCARAELHLLLDLSVAHFSPDDPFVLRHQDHFFHNAREETSLPDPRFAHDINRRLSAQLRLDADGLRLANDYWQHKLAAWLEAGINGFRCLDIARTPPALWRELIAQTKAAHADAAFLAWTPGCTPEQLAALQGVGFDAVFSSDAWWDYRAAWFAEEHQRLAAIAAVIAAPEDPTGSRLRTVLRLDEPDQTRRAYRRAVLAAAASGDGLLLTQGFEFGTDLPLADLPHDLDTSGQVLFDLSKDISEANRRIVSHAGRHLHHLRLLSAPHTDLALLLRQDDASKKTSALLTIINADLTQRQSVTAGSLRERTAGMIMDETANGDTATGNISDEYALSVPPGDVLFVEMQAAKQIVSPPAGGKALVKRAAGMPRIALENITPSVDDGRFAVKRIIGNTIAVEADIFGEGHDLLAAVVQWRAIDEKDWHEAPMQLRSNDRWRAVLPLQRLGRYLFAIEAWRDAFAGWRDELEKKVNAGIDVTLELQEGRSLLERMIAEQSADGLHLAALKDLLKQLPAKGRKKAGSGNTAVIALLLSPETAALMQQANVRNAVTRSPGEFKIDVERKAAEFANWYELFPRSQSGEANRHGTFDDVIKRLPALREMGFDTLYFPPIHPIGHTNRKGRNNSLLASADDPGSPYAIGSEAGGHDAIHPELGTLRDFRQLLAAAAEQGLEIALDFAVQCSPDHPWLREHPDWFAWRPDGTIRYAENPPKKYEDIVNVDFYAEGAAGSAIPYLWSALRDIVLRWVQEGVRVFRVDNPHTKPLPFWEWLIADIRSRAPDTIFLAEAFTRPKPMYRLAKLGFSQSYTYFTWRHSKQEFIDYLSELTSATPAGGPREFFRPHFFVNTPDINPYFLQHSGRPGFLIRAALATTLSGLWGMYSGFELCEAQAVTGKEEYLDSEKYEIRVWDWQRPGNIVREITRLNRIRHANPALQTHLNVQFHYASGDQILYFSKATRHADDAHYGDNVLLVAINLDPFAAHEASIDLPLWQFGLPDHGVLEVEELMSESRFTWHGRQQQIRLDPQQLPFAIWRVRAATQAN